MAKKTIANLNIQLGASSATLRKDFAGAAGAVRGLSADVAKSSAALNAFNAIKAKATGTVAAFANRLKGAAASLLAMAAAATVATVGMGGIVGQFEKIDATAKTADRIGATTEALIGLQHAGDLAGTSTETMEKGLGKFLRTLSEAEQGGKKSIEAITGLGLSVKDLSDVAPTEAFARIADALRELPTPAEKARAAFLLFGRQGEELINTLGQGGDALRENAAEATKLNLIYDRVDGSKIEEASDAWTRAKGAFVGVANQIAIAIAPAAEALAEKFTRIGVALGDMVEINRPLIEELTLSLVDGFGRGLDLLSTIISGFRELNETLKETQLWFAQVGDIAGRIVNPLEGASAFLQGKEPGHDFLQRQEADKHAKELLDAEAKQTAALFAAFDATAEAGDAAAAKAALEEQKKAARELERELDAWARTAERIRDSVATPFENARNAISEAEAALRRGVISFETFKRVESKALDELMESEKKAAEKRQPIKISSSVGAAVRGTAEGFSAVHSGQAALIAMRDATARTLELAKLRNKILEELKGLLTKRPPIEIISKKVSI